MKTITYDESKWKLVPVEPTPEMVSAAEEAYMPFGDMDIALRMAILSAPSAPKAGSGIYADDPLACSGCVSGCFRCRTSPPKADDPVKQMLLEALEKVDSEHEILGRMKTCELRRGRGSFGIAVMSDELALDWQSHQKNLERLIGLRHAAIAAARKEGGKV